MGLTPRSFDPYIGVWDFFAITSVIFSSAGVLPGYRNSDSCRRYGPIISLVSEAVWLG